MLTGESYITKKVIAEKFRFTPWLLLALAFLLLRIPAFAAWLAVYDPEQAVCGNLAKDLIDGLVIHPQYYQYMPFSHGSLILGVILTPFFFLLGKLYLSIKLVGLLIQLGAFLTWTALVNRVYGKRAAGPFALLYLICPPYFLEVTSQVWGNHAESILLFGLILHFLHRLVRLGGRQKDFLILGLLSGAATFFCFQASIISLLVFTIALSQIRQKPIVRLVLLACGFLIGFAPSLIINGVTGEWYHVLMIGPFETYLPFTQKLTGILTNVLPALVFPDHSISSWLYLLGFLTGVTLLFLSSRKTNKIAQAADNETAARRSVRLVIYLFPFLWALFYLCSKWDIPDHPTPYMARYAVLLAPFFLTWIAGSGAFFKRRLNLAWLLALFLTLVILADGGYIKILKQGVFVLALPDRWQIASQFKGYDYRVFNQSHLPFYMKRVENKRPWTWKKLPSARRIAGRISPDQQSFAQEFIGGWLAQGYDIDQGGRAPLRRPPECTDDLMLSGFARQSYMDLLTHIPAGYKWSDLIRPSEPECDVYWLGVGRGLLAALGQGNAVWETLLYFTDPDHPDADKSPNPQTITTAGLIGEAFASIALAKKQLVTQGLGQELALQTQRDPAALVDFLKLKDHQAGRFTDDLLRGIGRGLAVRTIYQRNKIPPDYIRSWTRDFRSLATMENSGELFAEGFLEELKLRGYRLKNIGRTGWRQLVFAD